MSFFNVGSQTIIKGGSQIASFASGGISSPTDISNCILYLDGNDPTTMGNPTSGSTFSVWNDKSGALNNFSQGTVAQYPTWVSNASPKGNGAVHFTYISSVTTGLKASAITGLSGAYTVYVQFKLGTVAPTGNAFAVALINGLSASASSVLGYSGGSYVYYQQAATSPSFVQAADANWHTLAMTYNNGGYGSLTSYALYFDGVSKTLSNLGSGAGTSTAVGYDGAVGDTGNDQYVDFVAVYSRQLSSAELAQLDTFAATR